MNKNLIISGLILFSTCAQMFAVGETAYLEEALKQKNQALADAVFSLLQKSDQDLYKADFKTSGLLDPKAPTGGAGDVPWTDADKTTIAKFVKLFRGGGTNAYGKQVEGLMTKDDATIVKPLTDAIDALAKKYPIK